MNETDTFVELVDHVLEEFNGQFPFACQYDSQFVGALLAGFASFVDFENQPPEVIDCFAENLATAVDCVRRTREARWAN